MKKLLAILFLFVVIGIVYSQGPSLIKEKVTSSKDKIKNTNNPKQSEIFV